VSGHNIGQKRTGTTPATCAALCDASSICVAFEFGVNYGGSPYQPGDCLLQDSSDSSGCPGREVNLDLYVKEQPVQIIGYTRTAGACVTGHNIGSKQTGKTPAACASLCDATSNCVAFEIGVEYGGSPYQPGDCILNDSNESIGCRGRAVNLDLFVKTSQLLKRQQQQQREQQHQEEPDRQVSAAGPRRNVEVVMSTTLGSVLCFLAVGVWPR